jgi:hypothetical protein
MDEQEIAAAIGWLLVTSGGLAVMLSSIFPRYGYRATSAGLLLGCLGLLIAGHSWAAVVVVWLILARYGWLLSLSPLQGSALRSPRGCPHGTACIHTFARPKHERSTLSRLPNNAATAGF